MKNFRQEWFAYMMCARTYGSSLHEHAGCLTMQLNITVLITISIFDHVLKVYLILSIG